MSALLSNRFGSGFENEACTQDASFFGALRIPSSLLRNSSCKWITIRLSNTCPLASIYGENCILPGLLEQLKTELEAIGHIVVDESIFLLSSSTNENKCLPENICDTIEMNRNDLWYELFDHW